MNLDETRELVVTCNWGLGPWLRQELEALGYEPGPAQPDRQGPKDGNPDVHVSSLSFPGTLRDAYRLNLRLRTGLRVLTPLETFRCPNPDALYEHVRQMPWEEWIPADGYLSVVSRVRHDTVTNTMFPNLRVKDGIVDRMLSLHDERPDSGPEKDECVIALRWTGEQATISIDTTGQKLSDRGYRKIPVAAPMRECLAAGVLIAAGHDGSAPLVNPMCGSGTIAIEAALIAAGRAPGLLRSNYALMHLAGFDREAWDEERRRAKAEAAEAGPAAPAPIVATDRDPTAVAAAKQNARTAGVEELITFSTCDFADTPLPGEGGAVVLNPEYGERLGDEELLKQTYGRIGDFFKQSCAGRTGYIFTGNAQLAKSVGLRTKRKVPFWNGDIECRLLKYVLYRGSVKAKHQAPPADA